MNFFKKKQNTKISVQTAVNIKKTHPFEEIENYHPLSKFELNLYSALREAIPVIDAAISKLVRLIGTFNIECEDENTAFMINKFLQNVKVGACSTGIDSFIFVHLNQLLTYGTAISEIIPNSSLNDIFALYNASLKNIILKENSEKLELKIYKKSQNKLIEIAHPELIITSVLNPEPENIYGNSIMKGLPFISRILLKIFASIGNNWERVGNARFAVTYKPPNDSSEQVYTKERAEMIATEWSKAMKNEIPTDFIAVGDVSIKVIGADNQVLDSKVPVRQILEQIISKFSIPPFLLGLSWSTTESMAVQQLEILNSELESYRRILNPVINKICNTWLDLKKIKTDFKIKWAYINLKDELRTANAELLKARTEELKIKNEALISKNKNKI
ncbi:MAG: serine/threonine protein phosphatase [Clostridia bacterium]|nr:serine/threonine protein phosphatase [Clostridia bacterium]